MADPLKVPTYQSIPCCHSLVHPFLLPDASSAHCRAQLFVHKNLCVVLLLPAHRQGCIWYYRLSSTPPTMWTAGDPVSMSPVSCCIMRSQGTSSLPDLAMWYTARTAAHASRLVSHHSVSQSSTPVATCAGHDRTLVPGGVRHASAVTRMPQHSRLLRRCLQRLCCASWDTDANASQAFAGSVNFRKVRATSASFTECHHSSPLYTCRPLRLRAQKAAGH